MVTHRLGVVRSLGVNKVVVLERGKIAEIGHPEDLLRAGGIYAQLALEQGITAVESLQTSSLSSTLMEVNRDEDGTSTSHTDSHIASSG